MINIKHTIIITALSAGAAFSASAQDVHFSQMGYSPMNLNPALAGANSPLQANVNYRSQWNSVAVPYKTIGASVDGRFNDGNRTKTGIIAGGINFYNDVSGDMRLTTTNINVNLAYHLILDRTSTLGVGIYGGYGQKGITAGNDQWGSQYDGMDYDPAIASNEVFNMPTFSYMDAGAGLVYTYRAHEGYMTQNNQRLVNGGVAFYHVNTPSNSYIASGNDKIYMRWSIFVNGLFGIENSRGALAPGVYFNRQKSSMEILYGTYYRHTITEGSKVTGFNKPFFMSVGLFHRWGDALVAKTMIEWYEYSFGFAYDINISKLNRSSSSIGGFELFLRYNMEPGSVTRSKI